MWLLVFIQFLIFWNIYTNIMPFYRGWGWLSFLMLTCENSLYRLDTLYREILCQLNVMWIFFSVCILPIFLMACFNSITCFVFDSLVSIFAIEYYTVQRSWQFLRKKKGRWRELQGGWFAPDWSWRCEITSVQAAMALSQCWPARTTQETLSVADKCAYLPILLSYC